MPTATSATDLSPEDYPTIIRALPKPDDQFGNARVDWKETPDFHLFKVDLPGLKKEDVKLEVERGRILQLSGEWSGEIKEERTYTWHCSERSSGKFLRRFKLPKSSKMDQIKAGMENGLLTVIVPKEEAKAIEISDDAHNLVVTVTTVPEEEEEEEEEGEVVKNVKAVEISGENINPGTWDPMDVDMVDPI